MPLLMLLAAAKTQAQDVYTVATPGPFTLSVHEPRLFGYTLGDTVVRELRLDADEPYRLVEGSLPEAGRIDLWLELDPPEVRREPRDGGERYRIVLRYRLINLADSEQVVTIAPLALEAGDGLVTRRLEVPELRVAARRVSPDPAVGGFPALRPLAPPPPLPLRNALWGFGAALGALLLGLTMLAWLYGLLPWLRRARGPFGRAYRDLKHAPRGGGDGARAALQRLHRAFDATAGHTVFREELDEFFAAHPRFTPLREPVEAFFAFSQRQFFDAGMQAPAVDTLALARRLRAAERQRA